MIIRKADIQDSESVRKLTEELEGVPFDSQEYKTRMFGVLSDPAYDLFVYEENGIAAYVLMMYKIPLHHHGNTAEILELCVLPEYRNRGIGHSLLDFCQSICREKELEELELSSSMWRKRAHKFYEENGFAKNHYNFVLKLK